MSHIRRPESGIIQSLGNWGISLIGSDPAFPLELHNGHRFLPIDCGRRIPRSSHPSGLKLTSLCDLQCPFSALLRQKKRIAGLWNSTVHSTGALIAESLANCRRPI